MAGKSWIQWLLPVDKKFYGLLGQLGRDVHESSKHLVELTRDEGNREAHLKAIHDLEHKADETARDLYQVTRKSLVHPIGPEDIFRLTRELDDVIDAIESTASRIQPALLIKRFPSTSLLRRATAPNSSPLFPRNAPH